MESIQSINRDQTSTSRTRRKILIGVIATVLAAICLLLVFLIDSDTFEKPSPFYQGPAMEPSVVLPNYDLRYYLRNLDSEESQAVCLLYSSIMDFQPQCKLPQGISKAELEAILLLMKAECPEIFQIDLSKSVVYHFTEDTQQVFLVELSYQMTKEEYQSKRTACQEAIDAILSGTEGMNPWEIEKHVFDSLAQSICYDDNAEYSENAYGALISDRAKCDGISLAMKWCLEEAGIECLCIFGDPKRGEVGHAWNMVCLDGQYYNVDLTASVRYEENAEEPYADEIIYYQFNTSDRWQEMNYTVNPAFTNMVEKPVCDTEDKNYFYLNDLWIRPLDQLNKKFAEAVRLSYESKKPVAIQLYGYDDYFNIQQNIDTYIFMMIPKDDYPIRANVQYACLDFQVVWVYIDWEKA